MSITAKTVILDIADNWGGTNNGIGIRSIEFWQNGVLVPNPASNFTARATSTKNSFYSPQYAFDTTLSKTGSDSYACWISWATHVTNRRLSCVFNEAITFDEIRINNYHNSGGLTNGGAKNVVITTSTDDITSTVYNSAITNSAVLYNGTFDEHAAVNTADEQILTLLEVPGPGVVASGGAVVGGESATASYVYIPGGALVGGSSAVSFSYYSDLVDGKNFTAKSVILDIADNWGDAQHIGVRAVDFWLNGAKIERLAVDLTAYATSEADFDFLADNAFDTSTDKIGASYYDAWLSDSLPTNQRLICVFNTNIVFDEIRVTNYHFGGTGTDQGARNVVIATSLNAVTSTVYSEDITHSRVIFTGEFEPHMSVNLEDEQVLGLLLRSASIVGSGGAVIGNRFGGFVSPKVHARQVVFDFTGMWGVTYGPGVRSIEFVSEGAVLPMIKGVDFTAYGIGYLSDHISDDYEFDNAFDTSLSKIDGAAGTSWLARYGETNNRLVILFNTEQSFDAIIINNYHNFSASTDYGAKATKITSTLDTTIDTAYNAQVAESLVLFDGEIAEHVSGVNEEDPVSITWASDIGGGIAGGAATIKFIGRALVVASGGALVGGGAIINDLGTRPVRLYRDFREDPMVSGLPVDLTALTGATNQWSVEAEPGSFGNKVLKSTMPSTGQYAPVGADGWSTESNDTVEVAVKFKMDDGSSGTYPILLRGSSNVSGQITGYVFGVSFTTLLIRRYLNSSAFNLKTTSFSPFSANTYYWLRAWIGMEDNGFGLTQTLKCKLWNASVDEPVDWGLETTDSQISGGATGIFALSSSQTITWDVLSIGVDGYSAELTGPEVFPDPATADMTAPCPSLGGNILMGGRGTGNMHALRVAVKAHSGGLASVRAAAPIISSAATNNILASGRVINKRVSITSSTGNTGDVRRPVSEIFSQAQNNILVNANVVQRCPYIDGVAQTSSVGFGQLVGHSPRLLAGTGSTCGITQKTPEVTASGETTIVGTGRLRQLDVRVASSMFVGPVAYGNISSRPPVFSGKTEDTIFALGDISTQVSSVEGHAVSSPVLAGRFIALHPRVSGCAAISAPTKIIKYRRDCPVIQ